MYKQPSLSLLLPLNSQNNMMDLKSLGLLTKKMYLELIGLNTMMDFLNHPLKSLVLLNEMMGFFRPNVLISDQRTYNKHDEDNLL